MKAILLRIGCHLSFISIISNFENTQYSMSMGFTIPNNNIFKWVNLFGKKVLKYT